MKKYLLFFVALFATITLKAQTGFDNDEWGVGADGGYIKGATNLRKQIGHPSLAVSVMYNAYLPIVAEFQVGRLSGGGETPATDLSGRYYRNNFYAFYLHSDFQLSTIINYPNSDLLNDIKGLYIGGGFGAVFDHNKDQRHNQYPQNDVIGGTRGFNGQDNAVSPTVLLRLGYEFKVWDSYNQPTMAFDIGFTNYWAYKEGLDGYNDPNPPFHNSHTSQYGQITIGIKYFFVHNYLP